MPIIPWKPFLEIFEDDWPENWLERPRLGSSKRIDEMPTVRVPRIDIFEEGSNIIAEVELPKIDPKDIDVEIKDNVLSVQAKSKEKKEEKGKGFYRKEISSGFFRRALPLPIEVIGQKAEADYQDGILKITVPKAKPKRDDKKGIKVKVKAGKKS